MPGIIGFAKAIDIAHESMAAENKRHRKWMLDLLDNLIDVGAVLNGHPIRRLAHNLNMGFEDVDGKAIINSVSDRLSISAGSACTIKTVEPSHVLIAMGLSEEQAYSSIRVGCGRFNTKDDIEIAADCIRNAVKSFIRIKS